MKGVVASELVIVLALIGCLYLLWLHDEQLKELETSYDRLRVAVGDLSESVKAAKPARAPRTPSKTKEAPAK